MRKHIEGEGASDFTGSFLLKTYNHIHDYYRTSDKPTPKTRVSLHHPFVLISILM